MSKQTAVAQEFEGEAAGRRIAWTPRRAGAPDGDSDPDGDGRHRPGDRLRETLVELGYNALVADIFGKKFRGRRAT